MRIQLAVLVVISLFGYCHVAPAFGDAFQLGTEQTYNYHNEVRLGGARNASHTVGYLIRAKVHVATVWGDDEQKLLRMKLSDLTLTAYPEGVKQTTTLTQLKAIPFYVSWKLGHIKRIFVQENEDVSLINFKRGVASLFQYQLLDGTYVEHDPSGSCEVLYTSHSTTRYHKAKINCNPTIERFERTEFPLRSLTRHSRSADYSVSSEGILEKVVAQDYMKYLVNAYDNFGAFVESVTKLEIEGGIGTVDTVRGKSAKDAVKAFGVYEPEKLLSQDFEPACLGDTCPNFVNRVKLLKDALINEKVGKQETAAALLELVQLGRATSAEDLSRVLKAKTMLGYRSQLLDVLGAIQTADSHEVAKSILKFETDEELFLAERYLQALAVGSRPSKDIIEHLLEIAKTKPQNKKFFETLLQTVASMAHRYAKLPGNSYDTEVVEAVRKFLQQQLSRCGKDKCKQKFIRSLHNLKSPKSVETLVKFALEGAPIVSVAAMKAVRSFSVFLWNDDYKAMFEDILFQISKKFDSSARALALDILLDLRPDLEELTHLMQLLKSSDKAYEVKQYLLQKLRMLADRCPDFAAMLQKVIRRDPTLNNYHALVPKGLSTALTRSYSSAPAFNASLVSLQEMSGGVLKRGIVDLTLDVQDEKFSMFTLGLFAGGLSSFVSSGDSEDIEDESDSIAGMELTVQGSVLRPLVFFDGKTELMGHVWSGTASESTPAYQATTLLQDNEDSFSLQNGAVVRLRTLGAISIDLNGQVTMSLWQRNAHSKVEQNTGIAVFGVLSLDTSFISAAINFDVLQEPKLHLTSDLDFSTDNILCMKLMQPDDILTRRTVQRVSIPGTKYRKVSTSKLRNKIAGFTHALNQKNNEMCSLITES